MICHWYPEPSYLFFAPDLPALLYYSHIPTMVVALLVGLVVFFNGRKLLLNKLLLAIALAFTGWTVINLFAWTNIQSDFILFTWSLFGVLQALISILSIYFVYVFLTKEQMPFAGKVALLLLIAPVFIFAPTDLSLSGFNLDQCDAYDYEGVAFLTYYSMLGIVAMLWNGYLFIRHYFKNTDRVFRKELIIMALGIETFLFLFFTIVYLSSILTIEEWFADSVLEFYGLFGMTIFMALIGFMIVRFREFNVTAHAAEALTVALVILVASQYTYANSTTTTLILTTVTLFLVSVASTYLIISVRNEVKQRHEIEMLAQKLEKANKRLKVLDQLKSEFVSIASHQLRSPLTSVRGYASMLLEGSYGALTDKAKDAVERIAESSRMMALSVEDYLNVSRIQAGNMKYVYSDFNLADMASHIVDDIRRDAIKKGLVLSFKSDLKKQGIVHADNGKTMQILHNLINNSIKYTPKGTVTVFAHDKGKQIFIDIIDTGIGMSPETMTNIFAKFERAKNANEVNVTGTGLGLYVAQKMAQEMGGDIEAFSDGEGKGSTFRLTLPLQM